MTHFNNDIEQITYQSPITVIDDIHPPRKALSKPPSSWSSSAISSINNAFLHKVIIGILSPLTYLIVILSAGFYCYAYINDVWHQPIILSGLMLSITTDGLILFLNLIQPRTKHTNLRFDPAKLTIVIICHNGEHVLQKTLRQALHHVPPKQLILVSDASVDKTETIAKSFGVRVFINSRNINKGLSINQVINRVFTPYVLVLDDDTRIGQTFIPTSLLDDGWSAVAFRIMPLPYPSLVNKLQQFEYGKTIFFGKASRKSIGAVSNISGAIGLYRTDLLKLQARRHSGQHGGEDQQRTLFTYLHSFGRGVTYIESSAYTLVPNTWRALWRQRSFKWSRSIQENFFLCWSIIASRHTPFLLKLEKSLQLFIFFTDPLRILLWWLILLNPLHLLTFYLFYLLLNTIAWRASRHATSFFLILLMPLYGLFKCLCRFIAHFYWFKVKYDYLIKNHYHRLVPDRNLFFEYGTVSVVVLFLWAVAIQRFFAVITG